MEVSLAEVKADIEKYIDLTDKQDILITNDGKKIARLIKAGSDESNVTESKTTHKNTAYAKKILSEEEIAERVTAMNEVFGCAYTTEEIDVDKIRMERFL